MLRRCPGQQRRAGGPKLACEREMHALPALAPPFHQVPISLVYRKDLAKLDGSDPMLLDA